MQINMSLQDQKVPHDKNYCCFPPAPLLCSRPLVLFMYVLIYTFICLRCETTSVFRITGSRYFSNNFAKKKIQKREKVKELEERRA